ncbi:MAG TPA: hypothetical protein VGL60_09815 [Acidimicrobiales bacterium]|jgi:hypothetical protein
MERPGRLAARSAGAAAIVAGVWLGGAGAVAAAGSAQTTHFSWSKASRHALVTDLRTTLGQDTVQLNASIQVDEDSTGPVTIGVQGGVDLTKRAAALTVSGSGANGASILPIQEVLDGGTLYIDVPNGPWYSVPLTSIEQKIGVSGSLEGESNPTQFLSLIAQQGGQVARTGSATLPDGTPVTDYHVVSDLDAANQAHRPLTIDPAQLKQLETALGSHTLAFDVAVDAQGRVRTLSSSMSLSPKALGAGNSAGPVAVDVTYSFSGYGTPVSVAPPPASSVQPLPPSALSQLKI